MTVTDFGEYYVYTTPSIAAGEVNWTLAPHWRPLRLTRGVMPTITQATLRLDYGHIKRRGASAFTYEKPLYNWYGQWVRLVSADANLEWQGMIVRADDRLGEEFQFGAEWLPSEGEQLFTAVGWEWFLARAYQGYSITSDPEEGFQDADRINYTLGCNTGFGYHRDTADNTLGNKSSTRLCFATNPDARTRWTAETFLRYLLKYHINTFAGDGLMPRTLQIDPLFASSYLQWFPTINTTGKTLLQIMMEIMPPQRGLNWFIAWSGDDLGNPTIYIDSMTKTGFTQPYLNLPKNRHVVSVSGLGADAKLQVDQRPDRKRPGVTCKGALQRAVYSAQVNQGQLERGWITGDSQYASYLNAGKGHPDYPDYDDPDLFPANNAEKVKVNDSIREGSQYDALFQLLVVPTYWNGRTYSPTQYQGDIAIVTDWEEPGQFRVGFVPSVLGFSNQLPIVTGLDYTDPSNPQGNPTPGQDPAFTAPMFFANVGEEGEAYWRPAEKIADGETSAGDPPKKSSYTLRMSRGRPGVHITASGSRLKHLAAKGEITDMEPTAKDPETDFREMIFTVCAETQYRAEASAGTPEWTAGQMIIEMGDRFRYDTMESGTVFGVEDGKLQYASFNEAAKKVLRDDRALLGSIAQLAYEWYGELRSTMTLTTNWHDGANLELGFLVDRAGYATPPAGKEEPLEVNAVVSQIIYDFTNGRITYGAGFTELDFRSLG